MVAVRGDIIPLLTDEGPERCPYSCCWLPSVTLPIPNTLLLLPAVVGLKCRPSLPDSNATVVRRSQLLSMQCCANALHKQWLA